MTLRARTVLVGLSAAVLVLGREHRIIAQGSIDATLTVTLADAKRAYKVGELIPLELEFTGTPGPQYEVQVFPVERTALDTERYVASPAGGAVDPEAEYNAAFMRAGSILSSTRRLDDAPLRLRVDLNQWLRFDRPGDYDLVVTSTRLRRARSATVELRSNPLHIRIEPADTGWAPAEAARALAAISEGTPPLVRQGINALRYLGTRDAALALVDLLAVGFGELTPAITAGLMGSPHRADIVAAMEARLDAGALLPAAFISDLTSLRVLLEPPSPRNSAAVTMEQLRAVESAYNRRWLEAIRRAPASAPALSAAMTRLERAQDLGFGTLLSDILAERPGPAQEAFLALPVRLQESLLRSRWNALNRPWFQSVIEALYDGWLGDFRIAAAGDAALTRLSEIDPARAQALALDEIRTAYRGITADTLTAIVTAPVPDVDDALVARYRSGLTQTTASGLDKAGSAAWLMARYGSASLLPFVRGVLRTGQACEIEAGLIAYLMRHDAAAARERMTDFERPAGCVTPPLSLLASRGWNDQLEHVTLVGLGEAQVSVVSGAAQLLGRYGSAEVKGALFDRLVQWEAEWRGRAADLDALATARESPEQIENALVNALFSNQRFSPTDDDISRIRSLCVTDRCRTQVDALTRIRTKP